MEKQKSLTAWALRIALVGILAIPFMIPITNTASAQEQSTAVVPAQDRPVRNLQDLNNAFVDIVASVEPAVVTVSTERVMTVQSSPFGNNDLFDFFFGPRSGRQRQQPREQQYHQEGLGSGTIVSADGNILTNNHVIAGADSIWVGLLDGRQFKAKVIGADPQTDIAVIKIEANNLPFMRIGNSDSLMVGQWVLAIGSPMSKSLAHTVTQGIVSAKGRSNLDLAAYEDFIQTDAAINPGNSGGPLVNMDGQLVGVNTAIVSQSGGFQGIGFAVPSNMAVHIMNSLIKSGKVVRGWLGVSIQEINPTIAKAMNLKSNTGALVGDVVADGPAKKAGIEAGDIIIAVNGKKIKNTTTLRNMIASTAPGTTVTVSVMRGDETKEFDVTLGELPASMALGGPAATAEQALGFTVSNLTGDLAKKYGITDEVPGVVITAIDPHGTAYASGVREGDIVLSVNRKPTKDTQAFASAVSNLKQGSTVLLRIYRQGSSFFVAFTL